MKKIMTIEDGIKNIETPYPLENGEWLEIVEYPVHGVQVLLQRRTGLPGSLDLNDYGESVVIREFGENESPKEYIDKCNEYLVKNGYALKKRTN